MTAWRVEQLDAQTGAAAIPALSEILVDCVGGGASVGFLAPLSDTKAGAFWDGVVGAAARSERILLVARDAEGSLQGTVQVVWAQPENQPHRADITKLLVHRRARRTGLGERLMREAERLAFAAGRTLLVLDTATPEAARLYERLGWRHCGTIPGYALDPDGRRCATKIYWKSLH